MKSGGLYAVEKQAESADRLRYYGAKPFLPGLIDCAKNLPATRVEHWGKSSDE